MTQTVNSLFIQRPHRQNTKNAFNECAILITIIVSILGHFFFRFVPISQHFAIFESENERCETQQKSKGKKQNFTQKLYMRSKCGLWCQLLPIFQYCQSNFIY